MNPASTTLTITPQARKVAYSSAAWRELLLPLVLVTTIFVYWPVIRHDFLNLDDNVYVFENPVLQRGVTLDGVRWAFHAPLNGMWHPLTLISLMIDAQIGGRSAKVFHLTNLWLHVLNTALLYKLSQKFCLNHWRSALVAAL